MMPPTDPATDTAAPPHGHAARRVILVAGGGRGVGAAVVAALAARGDAVAIHCHASLTEARRLATAITDQGGQALAVTANLREEGAVRAVVHRVADHFGRIDGLVACARLRRPQPLESLTPADLAAHFEVAVSGTLVMAQEVIAALVGQATGGCLVFRADPESGLPAAGELAAAVSQAAVPGLVRALAAEVRDYRPPIRVGCLIAGSAPTPPTTVARGMLALLDREPLAGDCLGLEAV